MTRTRFTRSSICPHLNPLPEGEEGAKRHARVAIKKNCRGVFRGDFSESKSWLHHSERFQGWLGHRACRLEAMSGLILRQRRACLRSENAVDFALIVTLLLKCCLHVGYRLARIHLRIRGVDRSIIIIAGAGIVAPG